MAFSSPPSSLSLLFLSSASTVMLLMFHQFVSSAQSYPVSFVSGPVRKSVAGVDVDVGGLYVIVYGLC